MVVNEPAKMWKILRPEESRDKAPSKLSISDVQDVASYNWLDESSPTILVPGIPPIWCPPRTPLHLNPDTGTRFVDQNSDRYPWSPVEPLIRAVATMNPSFDFNSVDFLTDRRPLHNVFGFVSGKEDDFKFGIESIGSTFLFVRMEKHTRDKIPTNQFWGYRRAFEEAYTKLDHSAEGSTSHHRIIFYSLGGVHFLVRSAVDAYVKDLVPTPSGGASMLGHLPRDEDLVAYMEATALSKAPPNFADTPDAPSISVREGGQSIPLAALVELRTRFKFAKRPLDFSQKMPDLWISQTPNFIDALHQNVGTKWSRARYHQPRMAEFVDVNLRPLGAEIAEWEADNKDAISSFLAVLKQVTDAARRIGTPCMICHTQGADHLVVSKAAPGTVPVQIDAIRNHWAVESDKS